MIFKIFTSPALCAIHFSCFAYSQAEEEVKQHSPSIATSEKADVIDAPDEWLTPTAKQMKAFRNGDIESLANYIGKENTVVLATMYKSHWVDIGTIKPLYGILACHYRIVASKNPNIEVGMKFVDYKYVEGAPKRSASWQKSQEQSIGRLMYIFNLKKNPLTKHNSPFQNTFSWDSEINVAHGGIRAYETLHATLKHSQERK